MSSGLRLSANPASSMSFAHAGTENPLVVTARLFLRGGGQLRVLLTSSPPSPPSPKLIPFNSCISYSPLEQEPPRSQHPDPGSPLVTASHYNTNTKRIKNMKVFQLPPSTVPVIIFHTNIWLKNTFPGTLLQQAATTVNVNDVLPTAISQCHL